MGHITSLVMLIVGVVTHNLVAPPTVSPQVFRDTPHVLGDHRVGRVEDGLRRAVVLLEHDCRGVRKGFLELQDVAQISTSEGVDRLVAVAHDRNPAMQFREQQDKLVLHRVGVLVLVDEDMREAVAPVLQDVGLGPEQFNGAHQQIVEVHGCRGDQSALIFQVDVCYALLEEPLGPVGKGGRRHVAILGSRDRGVD